MVFGVRLISALICVIALLMLGIGIGAAQTPDADEAHVTEFRDPRFNEDIFPRDPTESDLITGRYRTISATPAATAP